MSFIWQTANVWTIIYSALYITRQTFKWFKNQTNLIDEKFSYESD